MKERAIRIVVLSVVFVLAVMGFSYWVNRGNAGMTADMGSATLPTISFITEGYETNTIVGHKQEMNMVAMRDTIATCPDKGSLTIKIRHLEEEFDSLEYTIYTLDGARVLLQDTVKNIEGTMSLAMGDAFQSTEEGVLRIALIQNKTPLYYYTRIVRQQDYHVKECLEYVKTLHNEMLQKTDGGSVKKGMEPN